MRYRMDYTLIKRKLGTGRVVYYYAVYDDLTGKRVYRSTGEKTKAMAEKYVRELADEGKLGIKDRSKVLLKDYAKDFFIPGKCPIEKNAHARGRSMTKATLAIRRTSLNEHILPHLGNMPISCITAAHINKWLLELPAKDKISRATANRQMSALSSILDYAVKDGMLRTNPCKNIELLGNDTKTRKAFTLEEVKTIIGKEENWPNPMIRTICMVAALTGMRLGEIRALKPDCVSPEAITIKASYSNIDGHKTPKNGRERIAPITEELYKSIMKYNWGDGGYIFRLYKPDKPMSSAWIEKELNRRMERVGIKGKTFHSFRYFFNTQCMSNNINETALRAVMGHANEEMTKRYLDVESAEFPYFRKVQDTIAENFA